MQNFPEEKQRWKIFLCVLHRQVFYESEVVLEIAVQYVRNRLSIRSVSQSISVVVDFRALRPVQ